LSDNNNNNNNEIQYRHVEKITTEEQQSDRAPRTGFPRVTGSPAAVEDDDSDGTELIPEEALVDRDCVSGSGSSPTAPGTGTGIELGAICTFRPAHH
jgi:hypothetical protein